MIEFSNESILINEIKRGNTRAFEYLFKNYYSRLRGYAIRFVDDETACDIIQECFLRLWEKREVLSAGSIISLLFAMVRNGCLNYLKHVSIVEKHQIEYLANINGEERLYHADFSMDVEHKLLYKELVEQINVVLDSLPVRCREVFVMSRFKGMKNREIAEKLQVSTTSVEKQISKALLSFSKYFKDKYPVDVYIMILAWVIMNQK